VHGTGPGGEHPGLFELVFGEDNVARQVRSCVITLAQRASRPISAVVSPAAARARKAGLEKQAALAPRSEAAFPHARFPAGARGSIGFIRRLLLYRLRA